MTQPDPDVQLPAVRRICLRLDNGTRIGCCPSLGVEADGQAVRLDFPAGFEKGIVCEDDLIRISEICGLLDARTEAAVAPKRKSENAVQHKEQKRQRVQKVYQDPAADAWVEKALRVMDMLRKNRNTISFREPVKPTATFAPDYFKVVMNPMDLGTVTKNLRAGRYQLCQEFESDLSLIWDNAILYNGPNSAYGKVASDLRKYTAAALAKCGISGSVPAESGGRNRRQTAGHAPLKWEPLAAEPSDSKRSRSTRSRPAPKTQARRDRQEATSGPALNRGPFSIPARDDLGSKLETLDEDALARVAVIVDGHVGMDEAGEMELDMQVLPDEVCWQLHDLVQTALGGGGYAPEVHGPQLTSGEEISEDEDTDDD